MVISPLKIWSALFRQNLKTFGFVFISIVGLTALTWLSFNRTKNVLHGLIVSLVIHLLFGVVIAFVSNYNFFVHLWVFIVPSYAFVGIIYLYAMPKYEKPLSIWEYEYTYNRGKGKFRVNVKRGAIIYGAAGSGKTFTGYFPVFRWQAQNKISGVVYDHKDFELTEYFLWFNKKYGGLPFNIFAPHRPELSQSINPIAPRYIKDMNALTVMTLSLMQNLASDSKSSNAQYFINAGAGLIAGIIWRVKKENPSKCTLPHIASYIFQHSTEDYQAFLEQDIEAKILASTFIEGLANERLAGSIKGSVADAISKICRKEFFAIMEHDGVDLALNKIDNPTNLLLVNQPGFSKAFSPLLSLIFECCKIQMSVREQNPSAMVLDEAGMIWLNELYNIPALLRSFDIATIFGIQDMVQGKLLYSADEFKALQANLSTIIFGKANDPVTADYYEKLFGFVEEDKQSTSKKVGGFFGSSGDASVTTSKKEVRKVRAHEFMKIGEGEFYMIDDKGEDTFAKWDLIDWGSLKPPIVNKHWDEITLQNNFNRIIEEGLDILTPKEESY